MCDTILITFPPFSFNNIRRRTSISETNEQPLISLLAPFLISGLIVFNFFLN